MRGRSVVKDFTAALLPDLVSADVRGLRDELRAAEGQAREPAA